MAGLVEPQSIQANEVQVWLIDGSCERDDLLSPQEIIRAMDFRVERTRDEFRTARSALRLLLNHYFPGVVTDAFQIESGLYGKPSLLYPYSSLRFNISHSHGQVVIAFAQGREVGIDIEVTNRIGDLRDIAKSSFSSLEIRSLENLSGEKFASRFFEIWTLKEAYIKARGLGFNLPLDEFSILIPAERSEGKMISVETATVSGEVPKFWHLDLLGPQNFTKAGQEVGQPIQIAIAVAKESENEQVRLTCFTKNIRF